MKKGIKYLLPILLFIVSCSGRTGNTETGDIKLSDSERDVIMNTLFATQDAWNTGNMEEYMKAYWESEKLVFTGATGPTYGYNKTLERYKLSYPDKETMGVLKFKVIDLYKIDQKTALMIGQFYLSRSMGDVIGFYTLVWQKIDGEWLIISDHSSGQAIKQ